MSCRRLGAGAVFLLASMQAFSQDAINIGSGACIAASPGQTVTVPVYIRDVAGTPLGVELPGNHIQGISFRINPSPLASIATDGSGLLQISRVRAGVLAAVTPDYEYNQATSSSFSYLFLSTESGSAIPFTSNASPPGDLIVNLSVAVSNAAPAGTAINLTIDPSPTVTVLGNDGGTVGEAVGSALILGSGCISVLGNGSVIAQATSQTSVFVSWTGSAPQYRLERRTATVDWTGVGGTLTTTSYTDAGVSANAAYAYRVVMLDGSGNPVSTGNADIATTFDYSPSVAPGSVLRASHVNTVANATNEVRRVARLGTTPLNVAVGQTISAGQITNIRTALNQARTQLGMTAVTFTRPALTPGVTVIAGVDVAELRQSLQ